MIDIEKIDHVGIRVRDKARSIAFYAGLGFELLADIGFEKGHPIIMRHPSGVVINLLGPSTEDEDENILMDVATKYAGYTHMSLKVTSLDDLEAFLDDRNIPVTGRFTFKDMRALFIRDPDKNVIEFDDYPGGEPEARLDPSDDFDDFDAYDQHP